MTPSSNQGDFTEEDSKIAQHEFGRRYYPAAVGVTGVLLALVLGAFWRPAVLSLLIVVPIGLLSVGLLFVGLRRAHMIALDYGSRRVSEGSFRFRAKVVQLGNATYRWASPARRLDARSSAVTWEPVKDEEAVIRYLPHSGVVLKVTRAAPDDSG